MKLEDRMRLSIRRRAGNVILRADVAGLGSASQVTHALDVLQRKGELIRMGLGVYAKAAREAGSDRVRPLADFETLVQEASEKLGVPWQDDKPSKWGSAERANTDSAEFVVPTGNRRISRKLSLDGQEVRFVSNGRRSWKESRRNARKRLVIPTADVARFVEGLARRFHIAYTPTSMDRWAETVTRLAGDEVRPDAVQDLLVALKRSGKLSAAEMASLLINHLREQKHRVRSV